VISDEDLVQVAREARLRAYAPYSRFLVGAALLSQTGKVYTGCNVENASYGLTVCAERSAVFRAVGEGEQEFVKIAVIGGSQTMPEHEQREIISPCGACRQVLVEFSPDLEVIMSNLKGEIKVLKLSELLPHAFHRKGASQK
jgi:cytidine deaminase